MITGSESSITDHLRSTILRTSSSHTQQYLERLAQHATICSQNESSEASKKRNGALASRSTIAGTVQPRLRVPTFSYYKVKKCHSYEGARSTAVEIKLHRVCSNACGAERVICATQSEKEWWW